MYVVLDFTDRDDLEDPHLGEEVDDFFFCFCFLGIFGRSVGAMSLNISDPSCPPIDCSKSVRAKQKAVSISCYREKYYVHTIVCVSMIRKT